MRTTPVIVNDVIQIVELPEGFSRVWEGRIDVGDMYLHHQQLTQGVIEWVRLSFEKIVQDSFRSPEGFYDSARWFTCLVRQRSDDVGKPCFVCEADSPNEPGGMCNGCLYYLHRGDILE